jgi:hypothetical protein
MVADAGIKLGFIGEDGKCGGSVLFLEYVE